MKTEKTFLIAFFLILMNYSFSQSLSLSPANLVPNIVTITAVEAGALPSNPMVNNTSQSLVYKFKKTGGWGSQDLGYVDVISWWLPSGIKLKVKADNNTGPAQKNGLAAPEVSLYINPNQNDWQNFIYNIQTTSQVSRVITMSAEVTNFANLAVGLYTVSVQYRLSF